MKRWQDRGEVLDSDDEESQSQERSPKRVKAVVDVHEDGVVARDEDLSSQQLGRSYKRNELQDVSMKDEKVEEVETANQQGSVRTQDQNERGEPDETAQQSSGQLMQHPETEALGTCAIPQAESPEVFGEGALNLEDHSPTKVFDGSQSDGSERLLDIRELLAARVDVQQQQRAGARSIPSIAPSSPLSERDVSPPQELHAVHLNSSQPVTVPSQVTARRSLRDRKDKQLHPYAFEKAQHQKQFRERGMRPIRVDPQRREMETQDAALSGDESDRSSQTNTRRHEPSSELGNNSSPCGVSPAASNNQVASSSSDEDLQEMPVFLRRPASTNTYGSVKRRKLFPVDPKTKHVSTEQLHEPTSQVQDEFSIPPSPPPTSSDRSSRTHSTRRAHAEFCMPRGLTPDPLPTPQISSGIRGNVAEALTATQPVDEHPSRKSRAVNSSRTPQQPVAIDSSSEASEHEGQEVIDYRRLQKERKRIRGVLPASWLKIDLRAQQKQPSPSRRPRRQSSPSPMKPATQKGVAHIITSGRSGSPGRRNATAILSDESEEDDAPLLPSQPGMRQAKLHFERAWATTAPTELGDDERMEIDWVDPMLAGTSRPRSGHKQRKKRQPRILESFGRSRRNSVDYSEERKALRRFNASHSRGTELRRTQNRRQPRKTVAPRLSVVDVLESTDAKMLDAPQFLRVAVRRAQMQSDQGRHLPTNKHIRLATRQDTEDATSILQAWQEGTIKPRSIHETRARRSIDSLAEGPDMESPRPLPERAPLEEIHHNRQQRLPAPLRSQTKPQTKRPASGIRGAGSKMRQTRLQPIVQPPENNSLNEDLEEQLPSPHEATGTRQQARRPLLVQMQPVRYRGAQLETLEGNFTREHRAAAFESRMHQLTENIVRPSRALSKDFQLARFLNEASAVAEQQKRVNTEKQGSGRDPGATPYKLTLPQRPRKRQAQRLDVEAREYRQPSEPLPETIDISDTPEARSAADGPVLQGLGPFGTRYSTDFDILPLPIGTYFHESSFIGSGDFAASLDFPGRDLDIPTGIIRVHVDGDVLEWGPWTEDVAVGIARIPGAVSAALHNIDPEAGSASAQTLSLVLANIDYLLRSTVRYFTRCLAFLDAVDRRQCVASLQRLVERLLEAVAEHASKGSFAGDVLSRCLQYTSVLSKQQVELCDHNLIQADFKARGQELHVRAMNRLASDLVSGGLQELRSLYESQRQAAKREVGIRDADTAMCSTVTLHHITQGPNRAPDSFWNTIFTAFRVDYPALRTGPAFDKVWCDFFTLLPALEIDGHGVVRPGSRFEAASEDWTLPRFLIGRLYELYPTTSRIHGSTINEYIRATMTRCFHLITKWGWRRCDALLGVVFDFFARRGLAPLHNEESHGSRRFLEELENRPNLEAQAEDRAFHIFLKMLASGLLGMQKSGTYSNKKIGGIAWRFIPNHGRTYRRDTELRREDLEALRNHHDLLCTLYHAAPPGNRLRASLVQDLVDHSVSHREACRLNIRAWAALASFQASTSEPAERLEDFCRWFQSMLNTAIAQYRLVRNEVEQEVAEARAQSRLELSSAIIEDTIARNQRSVAATLVDLLAALKGALQSSSSLSCMWHLLKGSIFWQVFDLFEPTASRLYNVFQEALSVIEIALDTQHKLVSAVESQHFSEDSQDYGDFSALQQLTSTQDVAQAPHANLVDIVHDPLFRLISTVFGADSSTDDALLTKLVDVWLRAAQERVRSEHTSWSGYISGYGYEAWSQLRDTEQKTKYTPYFMSRIVDLGSVDASETSILTTWLVCLAEREATLKFQHKLTSALLNNRGAEPLVNNLPFIRSADGKYDISLQEIRQRRLALISTVLSNMHKNFDQTMRARPSVLQELRQTYASMLKQLMHAMKINYQSLQALRTTAVADISAKGAYVEFVQQVISLLQQHTTDICQVDRFFTDSAAFPLPANDPTYVVGRLRSYVPKLSDSRKRKELATFMQTVIERAVVDGQQAYLIGQLVSAMIGVLERSSPKTPSLRHVLCGAIFPAYIEHALSTACSWIVAVPILEVCSQVAKEFLHDVNMNERESIDMAEEALCALLRSTLGQVATSLEHPGRLSLPHIQSTLSAIFNFAVCCLTFSEFVGRSPQTASSVSSRLLHVLERYSASIESYLSDTEHPRHVGDSPELSALRSSWPDTLDYVRTQVYNKFSNDWHAHDGQYFVKRGNQLVPISVIFENDEKSRLLGTVVDFRRNYNTIFRRRRHVQYTIEDGECGIETVLV